nr:MAG TPA: hypothetical protein [Caudoviricetes sp.]
MSYFTIKNKKGYPHFRIAPFFYIIRFLIIFYTPSKNKSDSFHFEPLF